MMESSMEVDHDHDGAATTEEWEHVFNTNVKGTFLCYRAAAKVMIEQNRGGRIIGKSRAR